MLCVLSVPGVPVVLGFGRFGQGGEEVAPDEGFDAVDADGIAAWRPVLGCVFDHEAHGLVAVGGADGQGFVEGGGHPHAGFTDGGGGLDGIEDGAAHYPHLAVALGQAPCELLYLAPCLAVHRVVLGADVGEVVALLEGLAAPPHVGPRCHVPFVPAAVAVVLAAGFGECDVGVAAETELAVVQPVGLFGRQLPRHPVGAEGGVVVGGGVAQVAYDVLVGTVGRQLEALWCGAALGAGCVLAAGGGHEGQQHGYEACAEPQCATGRRPVVGLDGGR